MVVHIMEDQGSLSAARIIIDSHNKMRYHCQLIQTLFAPVLASPKRS